ncbi:pseudouridine synthase [Sphingomonas sp.]|uniref:pseudouridine synthase n=1 Tax=Sphingomonas sp. TaxID=28214 RepID=UPI000DB2E0B7|nr:pseudouridine synthase [Sphingomonas sp.]PZU09607.1 MAG: pseudouridine synthase [Sphingomonas sp.]
MAEPQRIAKLLARAGVASRREIERMIEARRIAIDGVAIETPATIVRSLAGVMVDGRPVAEPDHARLFLYHKPVGVLTAANDPMGRKTIYDRMPEGLPRVVPVGRLDLNTEGLLLLTTDGGLKRQLELPSTGVERTYRARCYGAITQAQLESLSEGIEIDGIRYGSIDANMERRTGANQWIELRLREGKNREVRRVLEYLGLEVNRLIRVSYGPFVLADLPSAGVVEVLQHDLVAFLKDLKNDPRMRQTTDGPAPRTAPVGDGATVRAEAPRPARSAGPTRVNAGPRPVRVAPGAPSADRRQTAARADARPPRTASARPDERTVPRRSGANPHKAKALPSTPPRETDIPAGHGEAPRPAKTVKGKGWAKASKSIKRVGIGAGRPKRADRPMTDAREDYQADPATRAPRPAPPAGRRGRGQPAGDGPPSPQPPRAPRPGKRP